MASESSKSSPPKSASPLSGGHSLATTVTMLVWLPTLLGALAATSSTGRDHEAQTAPLGEFERFVSTYERDYGSPGSAEYQRRLDIFQNSIERVKWLNTFRTDEDSAYYGITPYSDLTPDEFHRKVIRRQAGSAHGSRRTKRELGAQALLRRLPADIPRRKDWRELGVVSPVNNQGKCGACWAYSSVETIESMVAIKSGKTPPVRLSVQQLVDCSDGYNHGCDGGDTCEALGWLAENEVRLQTEAAYPTRDDAGACHLNSPTAVGVRINSTYTCENKTHHEEDMVVSLARHGPLIVAVDATSWQDYLGGIIQYHCESNRNHAVQIVGYDLTGLKPYYIVRNTWGPEFGLQGYLHIAIGKNLCAIAEEVSMVDVI